MKIKAMLFVFLLAVSRAEAALKIVATVPELADIARRVGGSLVTVDAMAKGPEDIHQVVMRPSFVTKLNRADAVVYLGLTIEHSFLPGLLEVSNNTRLRADPSGGSCAGEGCVDCSKGLHVLEKPETLSRAEGELHPQGNPHYNLDPEDGALIARNVADGLSRVDPDHKADYEKNLKGYLKELDAKLAKWRKWVEPLKGAKAVSYHKDVAYLARFTGIEFIDTIELKPGIAPTPTHLKELVEKMKAEKVALIVREQHFGPKTPDWLAEQTGAKVAVIGAMAGALPDAETFIKFSERNLKALLSAAGKEPS